MSETISPGTRKTYGVEMVCKVWKFPRSSFYHTKKASHKMAKKRGRSPSISDEELLEAIEKDIKASHFQGEPGSDLQFS